MILYIIDFQRVNQIYQTIIVNPWGVEPQSKEPESFILSIELRVHKECILWKCGCKITAIFVTLQHLQCKMGNLMPGLPVDINAKFLT